MRGVDRLSAGEYCMMLVWWDQVKQDKLPGLFTRASMALAQSVCAGVGRAAIEAAEGEDFPGELEEDHGQKRLITLMTLITCGNVRYRAISCDIVRYRAILSFTK